MTEFWNRPNAFSFRWGGVCLGLLAIVLPAGLLTAAPGDQPALPRKQPTANHELFDKLKREFKSGPEVTAACLSCHTAATLAEGFIKHGRALRAGSATVGGNVMIIAVLASDGRVGPQCGEIVQLTSRCLTATLETGLNVCKQ